MGQEQGTPNYADIEFLDRRIQQLEQECDELKAHCEELRSAMQVFVQRVDDGSAHSVRTYAQFKNLLNNLPVQSLAEIKAQAIEEMLEARGRHMAPNSADGVAAYVKKLREGIK